MIDSCLGKRAFLTVAAILVSGTLLGGCSLFQSEDPQFPTAPIAEESPLPATQSFAGTKKSTKEPAPSTARSLPSTGVEVIWAIPAEPVEGYVLRYGYSPEALSMEARVKSEELKQYNDPTYGSVFRYTVPNVPNDKPLYVSIAAFTEGTESEPSQVLEVPPPPSLNNNNML